MAIVAKLHTISKRQKDTSMMQLITQKKETWTALKHTPVMQRTRWISMKHNCATPTHFTPQILQALDLAKPSVPVVMNCGGYERVETLKRWEGKIDVYLPDLKYFSPELSAKYSAAPDYFVVASKAILEMHRQQPQLVWEGDLLKKGLIVRHLVLPGCWKDSLALLDFLDKNLPKDSFLLSLMSQYTPTAACAAYPEINRRVTTYEYRKVADRAAELGFSGFVQDRRSAKEEYTPPFDLEGV